MCWRKDEEQQDCDEHKDCAQREADHGTVASTNSVVLSVQLRSCRRSVSLVEYIGVELQNAVWKHCQLFLCRISFFNLECFGIDYLSEACLYGVVLNSKEIFGKFLKNLLECKLIDLTIWDEPPNLLPESFKDSPPVRHVLELISCVSSALHCSHLLYLQVLLHFRNVWNQKGGNLTLSCLHLVIP